MKVHSKFPNLRLGFSASRCCIIAVFQVILLGFVTIAFCLSSQQVFILVFERCNLQCSNGCFEITWNLYWILLKNRRHYIGKDEMLKTSFDEKTIEKNSDFEDFECSGPQPCFLPRMSHGGKKTSKIRRTINGE